MLEACVSFKLIERCPEIHAPCKRDICWQAQKLLKQSHQQQFIELYAGLHVSDSSPVVLKVKTTEAGTVHISTAICQGMPRHFCASFAQPRSWRVLVLPQRQCHCASPLRMALTCWTAMKTRSRAARAAICNEEGKAPRATKGANNWHSGEQQWRDDPQQIGTNLSAPQDCTAVLYNTHAPQISWSLDPMPVGASPPALTALPKKTARYPSPSTWAFWRCGSVKLQPPMTAEIEGRGSGNHHQAQQEIETSVTSTRHSRG